MMVFNILRLFVKVDKDGDSLKTLYAYLVLCHHEDEKAEFLELIIDVHLSCTSLIVLDKLVESGFYDVLFSCLKSSSERLKVSALRILAMCLSSSNVSERNKKYLVNHDSLYGMHIILNPENVSESLIACLVDISIGKTYDSSYMQKSKVTFNDARDKETYMILQEPAMFVTLLKFALKIPIPFVRFSLREMYCIFEFKGRQY